MGVYESGGVGPNLLTDGQHTAYQHRHQPDLSFALLDLLLVTGVVMGGAESKTSQSCDCF